VPYVTQESRQVLANKGNAALTCGELNFWITTTIDSWLGSKLSYGRINDAIGVIECVQVGSPLGKPDDEVDPSIEFMYRRIRQVVDAWKTENPPFQLKGVLRCVELELYRRLAAPYEDLKCAENGDVYQVRSNVAWPPQSKSLSV